MSQFRTYLFCFLGVLLLHSCCSKGSPATVGTAENQLIPDSVKAIGIWKFLKTDRYYEVFTDSTGRWYGPNTSIFIYDGTYITIQLWTMKDWMWKTPDDYYKVKSKWGHDTLFYLPPFGRKWEEMAIFKNERFTTSQMVNDSLIIFAYTKIKESEVEKEDSVILKKRKPHDYSIRPMDVYKED